MRGVFRRHSALPLGLHIYGLFMSLRIDVDKVRAVLLADGWHDVRNDSFNLDAYDYIWSDHALHSGGLGVCSIGFEFIDGDGYVLSGPLTSVLAVRQKR